MKITTCDLVSMQDLATAIDEVDTVKFTDVVKEFDSMSRLVSILLVLVWNCKLRIQQFSIQLLFVATTIYARR